MLFILLSLSIYFPVFVGFGSAFQKLFGVISDGLALKMISGIAFLVIIWSLLAFAIPLNLVVEICTILIGIAAFFYFKNYNFIWILIKNNKFLLPFGVLVIVFFASFSSFILDHFGYYVPTIQWISEVGIVKGIANLDLILGQMSSWHILQAGFSNFTDHFLKLNAAVLLLYLIYILEKKAWVHLSIFPILFFFLQSPSPELPSISFSLIILQEILNRNKNYSLLFFFSIFIFTLKPTIIWLPIFVLLYSIIINKSNFKFLIPGSLLFLFFIFKNIWTFGYPIFPVSFLDFGIPWKPNPELMKLSSEMAVLKTYDLQFSNIQIQNFSFWDYIKNWLFLDGIKAKIHWLYIISLLSFFVFALMKKSKIIYFLLLAIFIKSILILLFSAQYRFFLDVFFVIFFIFFHEIFKKKWSVIISGFVTILLMILFVAPQIIQTQLPSFRIGAFMKGFQKKQWYSPPEYELKKFKTYTIGNLTFNMVQDYPFSFDTPLPAISPSYVQQYLDIGIFPQKIGEDLKEGFTWRKLTDVEKIKLTKILKDGQSKR